MNALNGRYGARICPVIIVVIRLCDGLPVPSHRCALKLFDRGPHAKTDTFRHLARLDHVVRQENEN